MVKLQESRLDAVFHALGDPTRRLMLQRLAQGEQTVGQLADPFSMSLAAASKHIKALEGAGLISRIVRGRTHMCHLNAGPLRIADEWLRYYESFWTTRLDRLEELLRHDSAATSTGSAPPTSPTDPTASVTRPGGPRPRKGHATPASQRKSSKP